MLLILQGIGLIVLGATDLKDRLLVYLALGGLFSIATGIGLIRFDLWAQVSARVLAVIAILSSLRVGVL